MANKPAPPKLRVVFDANVYIAAGIRPGQYADQWLDIAATPYSTLQLFASKPILDEVYRKLTEKLGVNPTDASWFVERVRRIATVVKPNVRINAVPKDPDDNAIIECAVAAQAQLIVSADDHLLKLGMYQGIGIAHPRELKHIFATDYRNAA